MSNTVILGITSLFLALMWYLEIRSTNALKKQLREERDKKWDELTSFIFYVRTNKESITIQIYDDKNKAT